ncbi:MAG: hypothetical protein IGS48_05230 [Oscillatoriales cyanobacterium C42_A2020_001]|nr:hypothetical protein [Leptolyngbyaceae cyanobacterium C42_A2020_001]
MLKDASTNPVLMTSSHEEKLSRFHIVSKSVEPSQFSANTYAERLMDDLFQDIEHLLDMKPDPAEADASTTDFSAETPIPSPSQQVDAEESRLALPLARNEAISVPDPIAPGDRALAEVKESPTLTNPASTQETERSSKRTYERLLLAVGCISVVVSLALYLLYQDGKTRQQATAPSAVSTAATQPADSLNPFAAYAQKALRAIDQHTQQSSTTIPAPTGTTGTSALPTVTIPQTNAPSPLPNRTATGLERIYVPVYQIPSNLYPPGTAVAPLPSAGLPKTPAKGKSKPAIARTSTVARKLVGVLDQGDRSVALFETNGITQRYEIGESIGSSGWTLVEVTKDQAVIRRNGEVRSLFVGHSFQ